MQSSYPTPTQGVASESSQGQGRRNQSGDYQPDDLYAGTMLDQTTIGVTGGTTGNTGQASQSTFSGSQPQNSGRYLQSTKGDNL